MPKEIAPIDDRLRIFNDIVALLCKLGVQDQRSVLRGVLAFMQITLYAPDGDNEG